MVEGRNCHAMARHLWRDDIERRIAIRAEKDANPNVTYKDLHDKFGASGNLVAVALEKTTAEWKALLETTPARAKTREIPGAKPPVEQAISKDMPREPQVASIEPPTPAIAPSRACEWEYRAVAVRGRTQWNDVVYEQQGKNQGEWKQLAAKTFEGVLDMFGKDGWELAAMAVLSHGSAGFTGVYELAFKRRRR